MAIGRGAELGAAAAAGQGVKTAPAHETTTARNWILYEATKHYEASSSGLGS